MSDGERFHRCNIFQLPMTHTVAHGGRGEIRFHQIATADQVAGACNFIDFTRMPPGTTIGVHSHKSDEEEYYLVISGNGKMFRDGEEFTVGPGDLVRNEPGGTHALENTGETELQLFVFEVKVT